MGGDWERQAVQTVGQVSFASKHDQEQSASSPHQLAEHKAVSSLLQAVEFLAKRYALRPETLGEGDCHGPEAFLKALNVALTMAQHDIRDVATLQAALISGAFPDSTCRTSGKEIRPDKSLMRSIRARFGDEVVVLVRAVASTRNVAMMARLPHKAKLVMLAREVCSLNEMQTRGLTDEALINRFRSRVQEAKASLTHLHDVHGSLEASLLEIFDGRVRLFGGELIPVQDIVSRPWADFVL